MVESASQIDSRVITDDPYKIFRRHRRLLWRTFALLLPIAVVLAISAAYVTYFSADLWITLKLQAVPNPLFRNLMIGISWFGNNHNGIFCTIAIVAILLILRLNLEAGAVAFSAAFGELISSLLKATVGRPRPTIDLVHVYTRVTSQSFPSGHVFHYMALYGFLFYLAYILMQRSILKNCLLAIFALLVGLVGLSRMYLGEHWASDVLGGYMFGFVWLVLVIECYWKMKAKGLRKKQTA